MKNLFLILPVVFLSLSSFAKKSSGGSKGSSNLWEIRAQGGSFDTKPKKFNAQMETFVTNNPDIDKVKTSGIDFLFKKNSFMLGVRYERLEFEENGSGRISGTLHQTETTVTGTRAGALLGWRMYNSQKGFVALLGHYLPSQDFEYKISARNTLSQAVTTHKFTADKIEGGYGAAIESGVYIDKYGSAGLEVGYTAMAVDTFKKDGSTAVDSSSNNIKMDLSGLYVKAFVGVTF